MSTIPNEAIEDENQYDLADDIRQKNHKKNTSEQESPQEVKTPSKFRDSYTKYKESAAQSLRTCRDNAIPFVLKNKKPIIAASAVGIILIVGSLAISSSSQIQHKRQERYHNSEKFEFSSPEAKKLNEKFIATSSRSAMLQASQLKSEQQSITTMLDSVIANQHKLEKQTTALASEVAMMKQVSSNNPKALGSLEFSIKKLADSQAEFNTKLTTLSKNQSGMHQILTKLANNKALNLVPAHGWSVEAITKENFILKSPKGVESMYRVHDSLPGLGQIKRISKLPNGERALLIGKDYYISLTADNGLN